MSFDIGADTLVGATYNGIAFFDINIHAAIATGPIRMFTHQANPARYKKFH
jgi:hypothetical protein